MMKRIITVVFTLVITIAVLAISSGCARGYPSVEQLSGALKRCYALGHAAQNVHVYDGFTVRDLEVISVTSELYGTVWVLSAKLYDPYGQYVEDMAGQIFRNSLGGWTCQ